MQFPERPTCHDNDAQARMFAGMARPAEWPADMPNLSDERGYLWRPDGGRETTYERIEGTADEWRETGERFVFNPFRSCGYCGSIHPEDLLKVIEAGAELNGSDWKYGWPHKFYVENIPNPEPERVYQVGSEHRGGKVFNVRFSQRPTLHAKWYNTHLLDDGFDEEARAQLIAALDLHAGIAFTIVEGKLHYRAPHAGYQRTHLKFDGHPALQQPTEG